MNMIEYKGDLYGKIGSDYIKLVEDSDFVDKLKNENESLKCIIANSWTDEDIEEKENLITKLKCCYNCKHRIFGQISKCDLDKPLVTCDEWEFKE